ncbi:GNAT family N-acetyltransferase [Rubneribacter sp.]
MNIAVSACLLGEPCRFDGEARPCAHVRALAERHRLVPVCPEAAGGLPVPRPPSEIVAGEGVLRVASAAGDDVTDAFLEGARRTLARVRSEGCSLAILKAKSPSCGSGAVYDGTFSGALTAGYGVAARLLRAEGVRVVDENVLASCLAVSERRRPGASAPLLAGSAAECPALSTERLILRPLASADTADVFAYGRDPEVGPGTGWAPHRTKDDARFFVEEIASKPHVFGVFERGRDGSCGPCIGSVGLSPDPRRRNVDCLMLGYALARSAWGRGFMTEAAREVLRYGFEELGISLASCACYPSNDRSRRVIEKCGFSREGVMRGAESALDGTMRDLALHSMTRAEWEAARRGTAAG